ncbi:MAG: septum formation initiator family protein [Candidatus Omnitrophica bacterium]|nr:septum formation initiator family protein [Candidatus Omnitrophota bacterium]
MAKKKLIFAFLAVAILIAIYVPGFARLQQLKENNRMLEKRIDILNKTNEELEEEKKKLETDPTYIEKIAREKLGMVRKDEIVLR